MFHINAYDMAVAHINSVPDFITLCSRQVANNLIFDSFKMEK